jgi:aspartyl-tRNA(Asn)/glutamyl-tRNA(Gln) amidotransferase subunit B
MQALEAIIGLEVHAQMNTQSKMFCGCDNDAFGKSPNTTVCPICMGHPGTLPILNRSAVEKATKAAIAIGCTILHRNHLNRKNYFYPDLPMGYQISQYDFPLSKNGFISFSEGRVCRIARLHIENDAGKLIHAGGCSYCDYNRAGTPLMEIVTEPDIRSAQDAVLFAKELQRILIAVDASEADMYKGMMRFDVSISLRPKGEEKLYPRSEIKNLNSFKSLKKALVYEEKRLCALWGQNTPQQKEVTVHWNADKEMGEILRTKESAAEYRYFPEPDIPPLEFENVILDTITRSIGTLPQERMDNYHAAGLDSAQAKLLINSPRLADFYDEVAQAFGHERASSIILTQLIGFLKAEGKELVDGPDASAIKFLLQKIQEEKISGNAGKSVLRQMVRTGKSAADIIQEEGLQQISDPVELENLVQEALRNNPKTLQDLREGKKKAKGAIIGFVMQKTNGQANPVMVDSIVSKLV